ncbi:uncharacterized protein LOC124366957 isoform X3 [Homalodisca vitripennis]|uniref:uncharacterized protein LOC124366957 isoform X3 n=1 Tax=Homalodisca vitripennis TaxID=197043 RepID=UPI001EEB2D59|nr:uncharacterized protein LOC124366957 isoform X3 [Homalodisca vitripennis]
MGKSCEQLLPPSEALPGIGEHCVVFHNGKGFYYTCREYSTSFEKRQFKCVRAECGVTATMGPELGSPLQDDGSHTHPADWGYRDKCLLLQTIKERFLRDNSSASLILQEILSSLIFESEEDNEASCNFESITIEEQTPLNLFKVEPCLLDPIDENNELEEEMDKLSTTLPPTARTYGRTRSKEKRLIKLSPTHEENEEEEEEVQRPDFVAVPGADELCSRLGTPEDALADMDYEIEETKLNRKRKQMTCEREESPSKQVNVNSQTAIYPKEKKHRRNKCSFTGCERNKQQYPSLHYFKFPVRKPDICTQWVINCANDRLRLDHKSLQSRVVCEKHFIDDAFTSTMKSRLKHNAIPTEVLVDGDPPATVKNMN